MFFCESVKMELKRHVQYFATFAVALAAFTSSVSFSWTTPVIPKFHNNETDIRLTDTEISWLVSSAFPGVMLGCVVSGFTSDRFGRRTTILGAALPYAIGTIFVIAATQAWQLWLARFCWGFSSGGISTISVIYISEIASKEIRGSLSVFNRFMFTFGSFLVIAVGAIASYQTLSYMLVALSVGYFVACWWTPETPYYLLKQGKVAAAKKTLMKLNGYKDEEVLEEKLAAMRSHVQDETKNSGTYKELFTGKQYRKAIFIAVGLRLTHLMTGTMVLQQYLGRILQETDSNISVSIGMIMFSSIRITMCMLATVLVDKVGRRPLLIWSYTGAALTLTTLGTIFYFHEVLNKTPNYFGYVTLFTLMLYITVSTLGFDTINFLIPSEIFPLNIKSTAMTSLYLIVSVFTFLHVRSYQIVKDLSGLYGVFWLFACFSLSGAIFSYVVVPETKGKSLREIQLELQGDMYDDTNEELRKEKEEADKSVTNIEKSDELTSLKVPVVS